MRQIKCTLVVLFLATLMSNGTLKAGGDISVGEAVVTMSPIGQLTNRR